MGICAGYRQPVFEIDICGNTGDCRSADGPLFPKLQKRTERIRLSGWENLDEGADGSF